MSDHAVLYHLIHLSRLGGLSSKWKSFRHHHLFIKIDCYHSVTPITEGVLRTRGYNGKNEIECCWREKANYLLGSPFLKLKIENLPNY